MNLISKRSHGILAIFIILLSIALPLLSIVLICYSLYFAHIGDYARASYLLLCASFLIPRGGSKK